MIKNLKSCEEKLACKLSRQAELGLVTWNIKSKHTRMKKGQGVAAAGPPGRIKEIVELM